MSFRNISYFIFSLNRCSIGICYEGRLDADGKPSDTRTMEQRVALLEHRELPGVKKACPCFDCEEYREVFH